MEGQLLSEKAKLKEIKTKARELENQERRVKNIWEQKKAIYDEQKNKNDQLIDIMTDIEGKIIGLTKRINEGEEIRQENQEKLSVDMVYQLKF